MSENILSERLKIGKFLSLKDIDFEVKPFNIITGDMASGKSLLIKVLEFFEAIPRNLFLTLSNNLEVDEFYKHTAEVFDLRFRLDETELFEIEYLCSFNGITLDIKIFRDKKDILLKSNFLEKELPEWKKYLNELNKKRLEKNPIQQKKHEFAYYDEIENRMTLFERLSNMFGGYYPVSTIFVPATRAALAISKSNFSRPFSKHFSKREEKYYDYSEYHDYYINEFNNFTKFLKSIKNSKCESEVKKILKAEMRINGDISLKHIDGRIVDIAKSSSGQQEIVYVLLLLSRLFYFRYGNTKQQYIFIEEPEAHLFPCEQKLVLELICKRFNESFELNFELKHQPIKFFITTHSPYVLNTINNALIKGNIIKKFSGNEKYAEQILNDEETKEIPSLNYEKVSAIFINDKGGCDDILTEYDGDHVIDPDEINKIHKDILDDYNSLSDLKSKLKND
jgi:predicted ATPase